MVVSGRCLETCRFSPEVEDALPPQLPWCLGQAPWGERVSVYPGRVVVAGESDAALVRALQERLVARGCAPAGPLGRFDTATRTAVKLFQARFTDCLGRPLLVDGKVGPLTWASLFGCPGAEDPAPAVDASPLAARALEVARSQIGVREQPTGSNRGVEVDGYLRAVDLEPTQGSFAWCAAFVYWCFARAADELGVDNPAVRTAGVLDHWRRAGTVPRATKVKGAEAAQDPTLVPSGALFAISVGHGLGHMGFVESVTAGSLVTIEGNTNDDGSREGIGVFRRVGRKVNAINLGYVVYG